MAARSLCVYKYIMCAIYRCAIVGCSLQDPLCMIYKTPFTEIDNTCTPPLCTSKHFHCIFIFIWRWILILDSFSFSSECKMLCVRCCRLRFCCFGCCCCCFCAIMVIVFLYHHSLTCLFSISGNIYSDTFYVHVWKFLYMPRL